MELCISSNIRLLRNRFGYSLEGLAGIMGVSRQSVAKWESGETMPDIVNCVRLSALFKVSLDQLVTMPVGKMYDPHDDDLRLMGLVEIDDENRIRLPENIMEAFELEQGESVLLLADISKGIAITKCRKL